MCLIWYLLHIFLTDSFRLPQFNMNECSLTSEITYQTNVFTSLLLHFFFQTKEINLYKSSFHIIAVPTFYFCCSSNNYLISKIITWFVTYFIKTRKKLMSKLSQFLLACRANYVCHFCPQFLISLVEYSLLDVPTKIIPQRIQGKH